MGRQTLVMTKSLKFRIQEDGSDVDACLKLEKAWRLCKGLQVPPGYPLTEPAFVFFVPPRTCQSLRKKFDATSMAWGIPITAGPHPRTDLITLVMAERSI